jgi:trans-2,3-dihydro-3-hydroxyanthranilate isomerase
MPAALDGGARLPALGRPYREATMRLNYQLMDVFTDTPLEGNPLAVVHKADMLLDDQMQAVAREFNLSETVFLCKPSSERQAANVRIFTPTVELPFAGHPTIGAAVALGLISRASAVRLEEHIGVITCIFERVDRHVGHVRFALPKLPEDVGRAPTKLAIAGTLGIDPDEIGCGPYAPTLFSAGVPFYLVPVRNSGVLKKVRLERRGWEATYPHGHGSVYVFTETPEEKPHSHFAARMFSPGMGLGEDPATGAAAAALIGLLARHAEPGQHEFMLRQGVEMGRPSRIELQFRKNDEELVHGGIGGKAVLIGEGTFDLPE